MSRPASIRPPALVEGDIIGIVAPASNVDPTALAAACASLKRLGYTPDYLDSIFEKDLYFAGSVQRRVAELEHMFTNPAVRAVLCARGGYGANYLLPHLDVNKILANPKPFIGYSDNTCLLTWFADHGMATFHGPMAAKDFASAQGVDVDWWKAVLGSDATLERTFAAGELQVVSPGTAEGILYGGCLSILVSSLGTPYEIQTEGSILFLEDLNEKPYRIDRMLMQLKTAGKFRGVRGVIFGEMLDCTQPNGQDYSLQEVIARVLGGLNIPIVSGFSSGHVRGNNRVLPFGVRASLQVEGSVRLRIDGAVSRR